MPEDDREDEDESLDGQLIGDLVARGYTIKGVPGTDSYGSYGLDHFISSKALTKILVGGAIAFGLFHVAKRSGILDRLMPTETDRDEDQDMTKEYTRAEMLGAISTRKGGDGENVALIWFDEDPGKYDPALKGLGVKLSTPYLEDKKRMNTYLRLLKKGTRSKDKNGNPSRRWSKIEKVWAFSTDQADEVINITSKYFEVELVEDPRAIATGQHDEAESESVRRVKSGITKKIQEGTVPEIFRGRKLKLGGDDE